MGSEGCSQLESSELSHRSLHRLRSCQQLYRLDQPEDGWRWYVFREKTSAAKYLTFWPSLSLLSGTLENLLCIILRCQ